MIAFTVPIRIESEMNRREHWTVRKRRFDAQRGAVKLCFAVACTKADPDVWRKAIRGPLVVALIRIGVRKLDDDNLASGFKAVRDQIAQQIGVDDGDGRITWEYRQEKGRWREYAARIEIRPNPQSPEARK